MRESDNLIFIWHNPQNNPPPNNLRVLILFEDQVTHIKTVLSGILINFFWFLNLSEGNIHRQNNKFQINDFSILGWNYLPN